MGNLGSNSHSRTNLDQHSSKLQLLVQASLVKYPTARQVLVRCNMARQVRYKALQSDSVSLAN